MDTEGSCCQSTLTAAQIPHNKVHRELAISSASLNLSDTPSVTFARGLYCLQVMRRVSGAEKFSGKNQYALRVSPGIDCAFMVAFCITVDELFND